MLTVSQIKTPPEEIEELNALANLEGLRFVARLVDQFRSGSNTFPSQRHAIFDEPCTYISCAATGLINH